MPLLSSSTCEARPCTPTQPEIQALHDKCEELADDVRALATLVHALRGALVAVEGKGGAWAGRGSRLTWGEDDPESGDGQVGGADADPQCMGLSRPTQRSQP